MANSGGYSISMVARPTPRMRARAATPQRVLLAVTAAAEHFQIVEIQRIVAGGDRLDVMDGQIRTGPASLARVTIALERQSPDALPRGRGIQAISRSSPRPSRSTRSSRLRPAPRAASGGTGVEIAAAGADQELWHEISTPSTHNRKDHTAARWRSKSERRRGVFIRFRRKFG